MKLGRIRNIVLVALGVAVLCVLSGCLGSGGSLTNIPNDERAQINLKIRLGKLGVETVSDPGILTKSSTIRVQSMIVTFTSNLNDTVRDTLASALWDGIGTEDLIDQSVTMSISLRALRWWKIDIETRDQNDSVIHKGGAGPLPSRGGQSIELSIPLLDSRFVMYEAQYRLPREIWAANVAEGERVFQKIYFHRLVLKMNKAIMRDSTSLSPSITAGPRFISADSAKLKGSAGKFFFHPFTSGADTATHVQTYDYVPAGRHEFIIEAWGYLELDSVGGTAPRKLFEGTTQINIVKGAPLPPPDTLTMKWKGPGSAVTDTADMRPDDKTNLNFQVIFGRTQSGSMTLVVDPTVPF